EKPKPGRSRAHTGRSPWRRVNRGRISYDDAAALTECTRRTGEPSPLSSWYNAIWPPDPSGWWSFSPGRAGWMAMLWSTPIADHAIPAPAATVAARGTFFTAFQISLPSMSSLPLVRWERAYAALRASAEATGFVLSRMTITVATQARTRPTRWAVAYPELRARAASSARATPSPARASRTWETSPRRAATTARMTPPAKPAPSDIPMVRAKAWAEVARPANPAGTALRTSCNAALVTVPTDIPIKKNAAKTASRGASSVMASQPDAIAGGPIQIPVVSTVFSLTRSVTLPAMLAANVHPIVSHRTDHAARE